MNRDLQTKLNQYAKARKKKRKWLTVVASLCAVVAVGTSYILINPADTAQQETFCGFEEHKEHIDDCYEKVLVCQLSEEGHEHSDACYEEQQVLTCSLPETDGHTHSDTCYGTEEYLSCGSEETDGHQHGEDCYGTERVLICNDANEEHEHTDECYEENEVLTCQLKECEPHHHDETCYSTRPVLICNEEETAPHQHDDSCYETQTVCTCGMEECEPHQHSEECYEINRDHLMCELPIHEHTLQCFSNPEADIETASVWERTFRNVKLTGKWDEDVLAIAQTQLGYTESTANYEVQEDGTTMKGYTRYGDWYGNSYGDWCAMFCSFCLHYAEVDRDLMPIEASCQRWIDKLEANEPNLYHPAHNEVFADGTKVFEQEEDKYVPTPGDLIFFDWENYDPEHPENRDADHIGFVAELIYDEAANEIIKVKTIEGNSGDTVRCNTYDFADPSILGYGELPENPECGVRTIESQPAADGAIAVITGVLPENAQAEITAVPLTEEELIAYFGADKAALMTGYVAYDIKIMVDGTEWQPDNTVSVTVKHPELDLENGNKLGLAHVEDNTDTVTDVDVQKDENGDIVFSADGFSLYIIYTSFTVDFRYGDIEYSMDGMESMRLSELFAKLGIETNAADVQSVVFSEPALLSVEPTDDGDWLLISLKAFQTDETLTITFADGSVITIDTTDDVTSKSATWSTNDKTVTITVSGTNTSGSQRTVNLQYGAAGSTNYITVNSQSNVANRGSFNISYTLPSDSSSISAYLNWRVNRAASNNYSLGTIYDLMDLISVDASVKANYSDPNISFSDWLDSDYIGKDNYRNPSEPTTMAKLMTAFDYFYSGRVELPNVWCYHEGDTEPYAKLYTLYDATTANPEITNGDIIELHGDTVETKQSVIQNSITLRSDPNAEDGKKYKIDYQPAGGYLEYGIVYCDTKADGNPTEYVEESTGKKYFSTRDCITVSPAVYGTELDVRFENVVLDGFAATWKSGDLIDYHILQTIHDVELTLSGVTIQNYDIQSNLNSNGAISLDGRTTYTAPSGDSPAQYGNKLILTNGTVMQGCDGLTSNTDYSTGGIMLNSACLEMTDSTIKDCSSRRGSAIVVDKYSTAYLNDGAVIENAHAELQGSAIRSSGTVYLNEGSTIKNCTPKSGATTLQGGAVYNNAGKVYISGGTIENCSAANGGAIYNYHGTVDISGGEIKNCSATNGGGAIYNDDGVLTVSGGSMIGNTAADDPKDYDGASATLGSAVYQDGTMYLSGAPAYGADQDVYLPEGRVITRNGEITATTEMSVVLEDEVRFRDILVSQNEDGNIVEESNLLDLNVKLSDTAVATADGKVKNLAAVYNATGLGADNPGTGDALNVVELDISDIIVVTKVWSGDEEGTTHDPITVYLYKDGIEEPVDQLTLSEGNGWKGTFANIEVAANGTIPYHVSEGEFEDSDDYITEISDIDFVEGSKPEYWVPVSPNAFSSGEYVIYGNSAVLSHNGNQLSKSTPTRKTESITINGTTYTGYFEGDDITDNMIWISGGSNSTLRTKADTGETSYYLRLNSGSLSLNASYGSNWTMNNGTVRTGSYSSYRYLSLEDDAPSVVSFGAPAFQLYQKVEGEDRPGYYGVTVTNTKIQYTSLTVSKKWSDEAADRTVDSVDISLYKTGEDGVKATAELNESNNWTATFDRVIEPGPGDDFGYYVVEDFIPGYLSKSGDITKIVANQSYWVPASTNQFSANTSYLLYSNGRLITKDGNTVKANTVTRGMEVNGVNYSNYIPDTAVTDGAIWQTGDREGDRYSGYYYTLENGGKYLVYASSNTAGYQLSSNPNRVAMADNKKLNLYNLTWDDDDYHTSNRYLIVNSSTGAITTSNSKSYGSDFTLYVKKEVETTASGYEMTLYNERIEEYSAEENSEIAPPEISKTIDYLGDGVTNDDTDLLGNEHYRLYLDIDNLALSRTAYDLLLILDGTTSMCDDYILDGDYPVTHLDEVVNGSYGDGVVKDPNGHTGNQANANTLDRETDGLIYQFLNTNPGNRVGVVSFASYKGTGRPGTSGLLPSYNGELGTDTGTTIRQNWATKEQLLNGKPDEPENYYVNVRYAGSGTNYEAGYRKAEELLRNRNSDNPVILVFMTDGAPNYYLSGSDNTTDTRNDNDKNLCNREGYTLGRQLVENYNVVRASVVGVGNATGADALLRTHTDYLRFGDKSDGAKSVEGGYFRAESADTIHESMYMAAGLVGYAPIEITDELSEYVEFAEDTDLKITMQVPYTEPVTLWENGGSTDDNVSNGSAVVTGVIQTENGIKVTFDPSMERLPLNRITVSYNVSLSQKAKDDYKQNQNYPHEGNDKTDYLVTENVTSSLQPGYRSNTAAQAVYRDFDRSYLGQYDHPVVQVPYEPVVPVPPPEIDYPDPIDGGVEIGKQIDYLGNNGIAGMDELYRLYLSLEADEQPIDLLLVLDQSGSMAKTLAGGTANDTDADPSNDSRQKIMLDFLNGTQQSDGSYNGFIASFLAANDDNDLAILTFDRDSSLDTTKRYIHQWGDSTDHITKTLTPSGATNYTAALWAANEIWKLEAAKEAQEAEALGSAYTAPKKIMIFLSDGEPTLAYSDGKLQNGFTADTLVGYGNVTRYENIPMALTDYFAMAYRDRNGGDAKRRELVSNYSIIYDDAGEPYGSRCNYISGLVDDRAQFPVICKVTGMDVDAPGISYWPLGEIDSDVFKPWYDSVVIPAVNNGVLEAYLEWAETGIKSVGDTYDLFWLSEWAYSEFAEANDDVITYSIGFSQETDGKYGEAPAEGEEDTRRERAEVLKYMSGNNRFFQCNTADQLSEALNSVVLMSVTMSDELSEYVDFAQNPDLSITLSDARYEDYYEDGEDFAYLYSDGGFTELGELLLDTAATKISTADKAVDVVFKPGVPFNEQMKVEAAFTVQLTEKAYEDKESTGYTDTGDALTDHDTENPTSSGEEGFYSNDEAGAAWTRGGDHSEDFPKPVVQVPDPVDIGLKKIDAGGDFIGLAGAEFDLYREIKQAKDGSITYTDENGGEHYLIKINSETLISNRDSPLMLNGLRVGQYYLFETKAPDGYIRLERPVVFNLSTDAIWTSDENVKPDENNALLLQIKNTSGYKLPETGGPGTILYTLSGLVLMTGALMYGCMMRRKRERRRG